MTAIVRRLLIAGLLVTGASEDVGAIDREDPKWVECRATADTAKSIRACSALIDNAKESRVLTGEALSNRGFAYYTRNEYARAIADFDEAIAINGGFASSYFGRALAYEKSGDRGRAAVDFAKANRLDPDIGAGLVRRANAYFHAGDYRLAITDFDAAISLRPEDADSYYGRALAYKGVGEILNAVGDLTAAARLAPAGDSLKEEALFLIAALVPRLSPKSEVPSSKAATGAAEFLFTQDRVVSLKFPAASVSLKTKFNRESLEEGLKNYDVRYLGEMEGHEAFEVAREGRAFLNILGPNSTGHVSLVWDISGAIDATGVLPGDPAVWAYTTDSAYCDSGLSYTCRSEHSEAVHYIVEWTNDCPVKFQDSSDGGRTHLPECMTIRGFELQ